eukprot:gnl/TRDRNA2_/TRDRNA2_190310_c0_seq1.p1 gnl/TRDRNA2_/TRDRNA2_190310_c0~~gnl/TRDRNA2_/TRDRNA2_190310_c0_seq1.p1  ORF type:complete len:292 (-),score=59.38 gnl/TRDRNA2_/TRDRNA2_190310_c0_seq1:205-1038(-)
MPKAEEGENDLVLDSNLGRDSLFDVTGKVILVTGGGSGIGAMIAGGFAANGAVVYVCSRKDCSAYAAQLTKKGPGKCIAISADLTKQADVDRVVATLRQDSGKIHCLVNNAGANWAEPLEKFSVEGWNKTNDLNVTAVFVLTKCCLPLLKEAASKEDPARIINISSIDAITVPALDTFAYSAGKAAVVHMSEVLAGRLIDENITVNCVLPGAFQSRMMRATIKAAGEDALGRNKVGRRIGMPADVGGTCLFLASRAGAWMTGAKLVLDGGNVVAPRL